MEELPRVFRAVFHQAARKVFQPPDLNFHCSTVFFLFADCIRANNGSELATEESA